MLVVTEESHLDHGLPAEAISFIKKKYADRSAFFIDSFEIPSDWPDLKCGLRGPAVGDPPIPDSETFEAIRGNRKYPSRMVNVASKRTRICTVIAGPDDKGNSCVLYTSYGGPLAPREPNDPSLAGNDTGLAESRKFWGVHANAAL